jgi:lysophospholipase L1-like esterase
MPNLGTVRRFVVLVLVNAIVAGVLLEGFFVGMLHAPRLVAVSPRPLQRLVQQVYRHFNRAFIQFEPSCARYDPDVTYTLRPGGCTFGNIEFQNAYEVNRLGVRDTETALDAPEIIVLGDSHAMGWGVGQDEPFVRVLARATGRKTLDAGVSSYGTVRELTLLDRLDTSRLKVLVIQYADNDLPENLAFRKHGNRLPIMTRAQYENVVRYYTSQRGYFPGKYAFRLFMKVSHLEEPEPVDLRMPPATPAEEAELFLNAVEHASTKRLDGVQLVVLEINQQLNPPRPFIAALAEVKLRESYPEYIRRLVTVDSTTVLTMKEFYVLDDHMNARGHRAVGEALARAIRPVFGQ